MALPSGADGPAFSPSRGLGGGSDNEGRLVKADLVKAALAMAIGRRRPGPGLIRHSDRGSQYASEAYQRELDCDGMERGMSRKGNCWDNAVAERFSPKPEKRMRGPQTVPHPKRGQTGHHQSHRDVL